MGCTIGVLAQNSCPAAGQNDYDDSAAAAFCCGEYASFVLHDRAAKRHGANRNMGKRMIANVNVIALLVALVGCATSEDDEMVARKRCVSLRDHLVELRLENSTGINAAAHRENLRGALGEDFVSRCLALPAQQVKCALEPSDSVAAAECSATSN
jgi:hypothetical protein